MLAGGILSGLFCATLPAAEKLNADARVEALLTQMTLDEKIGQMVQVDMKAVPDRTDVRKYFLGSALSGGSSDPATGNTAQDWLQHVAGFQEQALQTRLKIPILYGIDAVHGHNNIDGATVFPHHIGRARRGMPNSSSGPSASLPRKPPAPASAGRSRRASLSRKTRVGAEPMKATATTPRL